VAARDNVIADFVMLSDQNSTAGFEIFTNVISGVYNRIGANNCLMTDLGFFFFVFYFLANDNRNLLFGNFYLI